MKRAARICVLTILGAGLATLSGVTRPAAAEPSEGDYWVLEETEGGVPILDLLKAVSKETGARIMYDPSSPSVVGRKVDFSGSVKMARTDLFSWLQSVLSYNRLVLVPIGIGPDQWALRDVNDSMAFAHPIYVQESELEAWKDRDGVFIVTTIRVKHLQDTSRARNALSQLSTQRVGRVNDVPGVRGFVIADYAPVVHSMWRLLKALDVDSTMLDAAPVPGKPGRTRPPAASKSEARIAAYERLLAQARTAAAAQYFLNRIQHLQTK